MLDAEEKGADLAVVPATQTHEVKVLTAADIGPDAVAMLEAMALPLPPAEEVVTLPRHKLESVLRELEDAQAGVSASSPSQNIRLLRDALARPQDELWAVHSVGPREFYPAFSKEDAEKHAQDVRDACAQAKGLAEVRGESTEFFPEIIVNVIPSPWEPAEHFEILAQLWHQDAEDMREMLRQKAPHAAQSGSIEA